MGHRAAAELWDEVRATRLAIPPADYISALPIHDAEEVVIESDDQDPPRWQSGSISGRTFVIRYEDSKRQISERQVICRTIEQKSGVHYLHAFCVLRERPRTFRTDRIASLADVVTGEFFEPAIDFLRHFMPDRVSASPFHYGLSPQQYADFNAALNVLAFIARCDGEWHPLEADAIEAFAVSYWLAAEIMSDLDEEEVRRHAARLAPDPESFWTSLSRCAANPLLARMIRRHVAAVIDADGVLDEHEAYWGGLIDEFLSAN